MSTAFGHGLVDPKIRGKPVSLANKVERVFCPKGARQGSLSAPPERENRGRGQADHCGVAEHKNLKNFWTYAQHRIERESGQYSGTRRADRRLLPFFSLVVGGGWVHGGGKPLLACPPSAAGRGDGFTSGLH